MPGGSQQQSSSRPRKRKVDEQNKDLRKRVKREVKISLSPREVVHLENGEMLNDTHIDVANQMLRKQFPDVRAFSHRVQNLPRPYIGPSQTDATVTITEFATQISLQDFGVLCRRPSTTSLTQISVLEWRSIHIRALLQTVHRIYHGSPSLSGGPFTFMWKDDG